MKVLHVYKTCYPETNGGVEQVIRSISEGSQKHGVTSKILTLTKIKKDPYMINGVEIIPVKQDFEISSNGFGINLFLKFYALSKWADVNHYHYPWPSGDLLSFFGKKKPSLVTYHSDIVKQKFLKILYKPIEILFLNKMNAIVATSPQYAKNSLNLQKYKDKVKLIPLAICPDHYEKRNKENTLKWEKRLGRGFFLFIGVLRYYKGITYLLHAASKNKLPLVIAGSGPLMDELKEEAKQLNLSNVTFLGFVTEEDKISLLELSKAFVFPSHLRSEAFGVSLLEAQLFSKPLITCEVGTGSSYVNQDCETGLIVTAANAQALSDAMLFLENEPEKAKRYGENGRVRFNRLFTNETQCEKYTDLYHSLVFKGSGKEKGINTQVI